MKNIDFPIFKTKMDSGTSFDLTDPSQRREYFEFKAGKEIRQLRDYLNSGKTFIVYLLGKKGSGKGTYSKMFGEIVAPDKVAHFSVGDMIRSFDEVVRDPKRKQELIDFLKKRYRGPVSVDQVVQEMEERSTKRLLPSELILALAEYEISKLGKKAIFIDGFPRGLDQISYALFFKHLIDYRNDPDIFALIDVSTTIIDARVKDRVICPVCNTSRNVKLLPTKHVEYDAEKQAFYLLCDNKDCESAKSGNPARMVTKEGDELGIAPIKDRLEKDELLMEQIWNMHGVSKILLRNAIPKTQTADNYDDYEITPEYQYSLENGEVKISQRPWEIADDEGIVSNSLMPPPVVVSLIKQLCAALAIDNNV